MKSFARLINALFFTYSHLDKMNLIHQYFQTTPDPERGYGLAIMANSLMFPTFKRTLIKELISERIDPVLFELSYDYVGDLSETIALLWPESRPTQALPLLSELIHVFNALPQNEIKNYLQQLLNQANATERWALLKLGTGSLRIGISARFLKKTLAKYGQVDVQEVEQVWHSLQPPYLDLFAWLEKKSAKPKANSLLFFHPVMLSHPLEEQAVACLDVQQFVLERKYDGIRVQVVVTSEGSALFTRTGDNISASFPELLQAFSSPVVLDGELVILRKEQIGRFNELQQRLNRKVISKKIMQAFPAGLIAYDLLFLENEDLRTQSFVVRRKKLEHWVACQSQAPMLLSNLLTLNPGQSLFELKEQILAENHPAVEGLMLKHRDSLYLAGRPKGQWYKWKRDPLTVDAVLMYAQRGHGKRSSFYSDYTFGLWHEGALLPIGKAYFGFTDEELIALDKWVRHHTVQRFGPVREVSKDLVFEVAFDAVNRSTRHKSGVALRFPRINRIRWDKPGSEADHLLTLKSLLSH